MISEENTNKKEEIDLIEVFRSIWTGRKTIIKYAIIFAILGLAVAILSPKKYTVSTTMVPQQDNSLSSKLGGLSSLASMAGIDMSTLNSSQTLSPLIYPNIVKSLSYQLDLLNTSFKCPEVDHPVSLFQYYNYYRKRGVLETIIKYSFGLPGLILKNLKGNDVQFNDSIKKQFIALTHEQDEALDKLEEDIMIGLSKKEGYLTLSATYGDPFLAAQVAQKAQSLLQDYITKYKIEQASDQLKFIQNRYNDKKAEFESAQRRLALFRDQNNNLSTATAKNEDDKLQSEYNIAFTVYMELAKQLEQAQIQVKDNTPILTVIDPVSIPNKKSAPNRPLIFIIWIFLGGIIGIMMVFGKQYISTIKKQWTQV